MKVLLTMPYTGKTFYANTHVDTLDLDIHYHYINSDNKDFPQNVIDVIKYHEKHHFYKYCLIEVEESLLQALKEHNIDYKIVMHDPSRKQEIINSINLIYTGSNKAKELEANWDNFINICKQEKNIVILKSNEFIDDSIIRS